MAAWQSSAGTPRGGAPRTTPSSRCGRVAIWRRRTIGIGVLPPEIAKVLGATGPMLRGSGVAWDLRKQMPYSGYENYEFEVATSDEAREILDLKGGDKLEV